METTHPGVRADMYLPNTASICPLIVAAAGVCPLESRAATTENAKKQQQRVSRYFIEAPEVSHILASNRVERLRCPGYRARIRPPQAFVRMQLEIAPGFYSGHLQPGSGWHRSISNDRSLRAPESLLRPSQRAACAAVPHERHRSAATTPR